MTYVWHRLVRILATDPNGRFELFGATVAAFWAALLLNVNSEMFTQRQFSAMAAIAPEWGWGVAVGLLAIMQLYALFADRRDLRRWVSLVGLMFWLFVSVMFFQAAGWSTTAYAAYMTMAAFYGDVFLRLGRHA